MSDEPIQTPPPPPIGPPDGPPGGPARRSFDWDPAAGWPNAITRAVIAFVVMLVVCGGTAFLLSEAIKDAPIGAQPPTGDLSTLDKVKVGGLYFAVAHRTAIAVDADLGDSGGILPERADLKVAMAVLGFTVLAAFLLYRGGRSVAQAAGGSGLAGGLHGAKVAVPYALLSLGLSFFSSFDFRGEGTAASLHPSYVGAFLWPFAIAAAAGFAGGLQSGDRERLEGPPWWSRVAPALSGGWRMLLLGLLFAYLGLQITALARTGEDLPFSPGYFRVLADADSPLQAASATEHVILTIPNQAVWVLVPSMGACDSASIGAGVRFKVDFLCYAHFPDQPQERSVPGGGDVLPISTPRFGSAPPINFLFLLVPLLATVLGGRRAARGAGSRREGVLAGVTAGLAFAVLVGVAIVLARISGDVSAAVQGGQLSAGANLVVGPDLIMGITFAVAWGVAGGALGGLIATRGLPARPEHPTEPVAVTGPPV